MMRVLLLVGLLVLLGGCAAKPYIKLSAGHIVDQTPFWNYDKDGNRVDNPCDASFRGELGAEKRLSAYIVLGMAYVHSSNIDCGWPEDDFDEYYKKSVELSVKVGGA